LIVNMLHEAPCKQEEFILRPHPGATGGNASLPDRRVRKIVLTDRQNCHKNKGLNNSPIAQSAESAGGGLTTKLRW
jgi:hypothetical protein